MFWINCNSNKKYFYGVTNGDPDASNASTQFDVAFGHYAGSGSNTHDGNIKGASEVVYKQYSSMLLDYEDYRDGGFFISSGSDVTTDNSKGKKVKICNS